MRELAAESLYADPPGEEGRGRRRAPGEPLARRRVRDRRRGRLRDRRLGGRGRGRRRRRVGPRHGRGRDHHYRDRGEARRRPKAAHFTLSASGDLLMHQPLLERALANGGGDDTTSPRSSARSSPMSRAWTRRSVTSRPRWARGRRRAIRSSTRRPTSRGDPAERLGRLRPPPTTRSTRARRGSTHGEALDRRRVAHTGSFSSGRREPRPTILGSPGSKFGFVSYTDATNGFPPRTPWSVNESGRRPARRGEGILRDAERAEAGADA